MVIGAGCADGSFCVWNLHSDGGEYSRSDIHLMMMIYRLAVLSNLTILFSTSCSQSCHSQGTGASWIWSMLRRQMVQCGGAVASVYRIRDGQGGLVYPSRRIDAQGERCFGGSCGSMFGVFREHPPSWLCRWRPSPNSSARWRLLYLQPNIMDCRQ
jgi:hypothetical protein